MYVILSRVIILFALIFLGFFIGKRGIIRQDFTPDLSNFLIKITLPATVFLSMVQPFNGELMQQGVWIFFAALVLHLASMLLGFLLAAVFKIPRENRGVWIFSCMFSNNGFMGFPLAMSVYGNDGMFLMAIANVATNLLIFSVGMKIITKHHPLKEKISLKKMLLTNINIAVVLGLVFFLFQIPLPEIIGDLLDYVSSLTAGLSMIVVGLSLSRIHLSTVFKGKDVWIISAVRLLAVPFLTAAAVKLSPLPDGMLMGQVIVMMAALPVASTASILAEQYNANTELAAKTVFVSTLLSVITIPVVMAAAF